MPSNQRYPWFFFYRIARLSLLVFLPTLFIILLFYRSSYKAGLVSQVSLQLEEDLKTIEYTLRLSEVDWKNWCDKLPKNLPVRYSLVDSEGNITCDTIKDYEGKKLEDNSEVLESFTSNFAIGSLKINDSLAVRKVVLLSSLKDNMNHFDRELFVKVVPFSLLSYLLFLFLFYKSTKPLGNILSKVNNFKLDVPFKKTLQQFYQKDEWLRIEDTLTEADIKFKDQINKIKTENEKIAAILESINDNIIAIDPFETILFYNTNFENKFIKKRDDREITPKIWHTFSDERILFAFKSVLTDGKPIHLKGIKISTSINPDRFFDLTITSLRGSDEKISGALGVFYDVTEFKRTEQMRVDFVANVSHEIRTPLTSIKGYTQILQAQKSKVDPSLHLFLEKILSNTERMISLFNDLLNLSVIESQNTLKFQELDLKELVESVAENISTNYPEKEIDFILNVELRTIKGDQRLMEQVLSNLIDNACKYSEKDKLQITIKAYTKDHKAILAIHDNGPGISKDHLQRIFERFYRVDSSRESSRGTGLGLSIVKHIIAKHGGRIWAESQENLGTTFIIELPLT